MQIKHGLIYSFVIYINFEIFIFKHHIFNWNTFQLGGIFIISEFKSI